MKYDEQKIRSIIQEYEDLLIYTHNRMKNHPELSNSTLDLGEFTIGEFCIQFTEYAKRYEDDSKYTVELSALWEDDWIEKIREANRLKYEAKLKFEAEQAEQKRKLLEEKDYNLYIKLKERFEK